MTCPGGALVTTGLARGNIEFPAGMFAIGGRSHHAGQAGGCSPLRDIPRFVSLMESGRFDAGAMIGAVVPLENMLEAYEDVAYRTSLFSIMTV
jgi:alcohol dehydrogenase